MHKPLESLLIALLTFQTVILIWYRDQSAWMITIVGALLIWFAFYEWDVLAKKKRFLQSFMHKWDPEKSPTAKSAPTGSALNKARKKDSIDLKRVEESVHVAVKEKNRFVFPSFPVGKRDVSQKLGTVLAYLIPLCIIAFVAIVNVFPYGLDNSVQVTVGTDTDTEGVLQVKDMGERQSVSNTAFRGIRDMGTLFFDPIISPEPTDLLILSLTGSNVFWQTPPVFPDVWDQNISTEDLVAEADHTLYSQILSPEVSAIEDQETFAVLLEDSFEPGEELVSGNIGLRVTSSEIILNILGVDYPTLLPERFLGQNQQIALSYDGEYKLFLAKDLVGRFPGDKLTNFEVLVDNSRLTAGFVPLQATFVSEDQCLLLDGKTRLILPESSAKFSERGFSIALDWTPTDDTVDYQQIMGHLNWEIYQNKKSVQFRIGLTSPDDASFRVTHPVGETFFDRTHKLMAVYSPATTLSQDGYIELYINDFLVGKQKIGQATLRTDYAQNLTFGQSYEGSKSAPFFEGEVCNPLIRMQTLPGQQKSEISVPYHTIENRIPVFGNGALEEVRLKVK